jgi:hypothetical protein
VRTLFGLLAGFAAVFLPAPCFAAPCPVEVTGTGTEAWSRAAAEVADGPSEDGSDCAKILVELDQNRARVTFTTADGRTAKRELAEPEELAPTLRALRVTGPLAGAPESETSTDRSPPDLATAGPRPEADSGPAPRSPGKTKRVDSSPSFAFLGGARGGESQLASPVLRASASVALERWELGVLGGFDLHYGHVPAASAPSDTWAWLAGVGVGRREPVGSVALLGGGRLMLAALRQEADAEGPREYSRAEIRVGAYGGLVLPRRAAWRFRADLGTELVPHDIGAAEDDRSRSPITPWWAASLILGVETGGS